MFSTLSAGAIGVQAPNLESALNAAKVGGFAGTEVNIAEIARRLDSDGAESLGQIIAASGIQVAAFGLPTNWRGDEATWLSELELLKTYAKAAEALDITRTATWIMPASNDLNFDANRRFHVERFGPIAEILGEHGISVGLEFIGPKTLRDQFRYPFIYTLEAMLDMGAEIGDNVGVLLDCWHWFTSGATVEDIEDLVAEDVVYVHVNDAPLGLTVDEQLDNVRCLPGETGVIDTAGFIEALRTIGYDGPVTPEPFKKDLADLPDDEARLRLVGAATNKILG
ncbi:MAG: sugar phosphate isomerase/epimerase family protein [Fimbriimonas sp.]